MFVIVVGGGRVGFYLTKELLAEGHELVLMEKDPRSAERIRDELGAVVVNRDGCEGTHLAEAGANRASIVAAVTGDDADNLVVCQMAKHHFAVPRTIARVNNPRNEALFRHLGVDEIISPTRMVLGAIEQDIPVHELLHLAAAGGRRAGAHRGPDRRRLASRSVDARPTSSCPRAARCSCSSATTVPRPMRPETVFQPGDKVIAVSRTECETDLRRQLIGRGAARSA